MAEVDQQPIDGVTYSSLASLLKQRSQARLLKRGSHNIHAGQSGQNLSIYKGRGMDFQESRAYQTGDDVRFLDWRVTAKTGKPHTKVFSEERERPVLLVVDYRNTMLFGTRRRFKSVLAAELASLLMWKGLSDGDKIGGLVIPASGKLAAFKPNRSYAAASRFMRGLSLATQATPTQINQSSSSSSLSLSLSLENALHRVRSIMETGTQLILLSDFRGLDDSSRQQLLKLSDKSSLVLLAINDPLEESIATYSGQLALASGHKKILLSPKRQEKYLRVYETRKAQLKHLARQTNISLLNLSTADSSATLMLKLSRGLR